jgi:glycine/betaine/sarcosine/D-proline reductase family selenoprotein B
MVKEIERCGIPVVHMCTVVPISLTVGANRIIPQFYSSSPGQPEFYPTDEKHLRRGLVEEH